ncbi:DNA polymerase III subunit gamma/tau [Microbacterium marinilacus]|uniref:DNA polymerase III subunit gamma/tau n=1 Tax=Microbacterium marinilacus TaxID=415209 RepID=A0ABP7B517_9MICO|nr:DNA polymerase III subunit gamma/tau [Microbacterium marinilacus]MBY0687869.1 DNA polymerase III subunit gamma/tau [Microbacterium marinilacus]
MSSRDDDALSWDGDDDSTLVAGDGRAAERTPERSTQRRPEPSESLPRGWRAVGRGSGEVVAASGESDETPPAAKTTGEGEDEAGSGPAPMGNVALICFGVLGGVYTLYVVGWILGGLRLREQLTGGAGVADAMSEAALWLGILAPVIWFAVTLYVTRGKPSWQRFAGLVLGVLLLVPWPFVMLGAVGL